jgi:uncharacterized protein with HEPN domain
MRNDKLRLLDALDQIKLIQEFSAHGKEAFFDDLLIQSALLHRLTLLGEACRGVSAELQLVHPEVPWPQIIAFRNIVVHEYFGLDLELVWEFIDKETAGLSSALQRILDSQDEKPS